MKEKPIVLGVDIGGSHITAALIDLERREIVPGSLKRQFVDAQEDAEKILNDWCTVISQSFDTTTLTQRKIGIAMPGPFDYEQGISKIKDQKKFQSLYNINVRQELSRRLNIQPENIRFINDAASFLQGEVFCGAARDYKKVLGLTLGTGLGSALCKEGVAEDADLWNSVFKDGIVEDYLSSRWFLQRYTELSDETVNDVKELTELKKSRTYLNQIFSDFSNNLVAFLAPLVEKHECDAVVIGGNISNAHTLFLPEVNQLLEENHIRVPIKSADLKGDASLIGAASRWEHSNRETQARPLTQGQPVKQNT